MNYFLVKYNGSFKRLTSVLVDLNGVKEQNVIAQHILQSMIGHPMLHCFFNPHHYATVLNHECRLMTQTKFETSKRKSEKKFDAMIAKLSVDQDKFANKKYVDERKICRGAFQLMPCAIRQSMIYALCASLSVTRQIISFLRDFISTKPCYAQ